MSGAPSSELDETTALTQLSPPCTRRAIGEGAMVAAAAFECDAYLDLWQAQVD